MATVTLQNWYRTRGGITSVKKFTVKTSQTLARYDWVIFDLTAGTVEIAAAAGADVAASKTCAGRILEPTTSAAASTKVLVECPNVDTEYLIPTSNDSTPLASSLAHIGNTYGLRNISGTWVVNQHQTTADQMYFRVIEYDPSYNIGDTNHPAWCRIVPGRFLN